MPTPPNAAPRAPAPGTPAKVTITRTVTETHSVATNRDAICVIHDLGGQLPDWLGSLRRTPPPAMWHINGRWQVCVVNACLVDEDADLWVLVLASDGTRGLFAPLGNLRPVTDEDAAAQFVPFDAEGTEA